MSSGNSLRQPPSLLTIRVDRLEPAPPVTAACAGYELGRWRCRALARHVLKWLPEFALRYSEWSTMDYANALERVAEAARAVYASESFERRGEFGEILLHILLRQHLGTIPAISKIFFKDSRNDTVKGFDAVHVLEDGDALEIWLGEVKFYSDLNDGIRSVINEMQKHTEANYLRDEFIAISNKLDDSWRHSQRLRELLARETSLDNVFSTLCLPVLLTYDSKAVRDHTEASTKYAAAFTSEIENAWSAFRDKLPTLPIRVHLFLLPLEDKAQLVREMDEGLRHAQELL